MSLPFSFCILPNEMLLKIFEMCDVYTLLQLNSVCKRFNEITNKILTQRSEHLLITNEMSKKFRERCKPRLLLWNSKFNTYYNWKNQRYRENYVCFASQCYNIPNITKRLEMTRNTVCFYGDKYLYAFNRGEDGNIKVSKDNFKICDSQFSCIAYCNDIIISGHEDGSIRTWKIESRDNNKFQQLKIHLNVYANHVLNIEATMQHVISSSSDLIKIQKNIFEEDGPVEQNEIIYADKKLVKSISLDPTETKLAASIGQLLLIYDINENRQIKDKCIELRGKFSRTTCFQLLWQDPHTILMLYERLIKKMDTRNMEFVRTWNLLLQNQELYNFSSDNLYTIITGTTKGRAILWDQRLSNSIQTYDLFSNAEYDICFNPVSVQFDSTHMYAVTRLDDLIELDFK